MLAQFPKFKKLEFSDRQEVEKITLKYPPYSDFDFTGMWSWDLHDNVQVSELNGNLLIVHQNFRSEGKVYSFLGNNHPNETLENIFSIIESGPEYTGTVGLVPEDSIAGIDLNKYVITIDFNACDYVYDLELLATYPGNKYAKKRKRLTTFLKSYQDIEARVLDIKNFQVQREVLMLIANWAKNRETEDDDPHLFLSKEYKAIYKFMQADFENIICLGVFAGNKLIGFNLMAILPNHYAMGLFLKYDKNFIGINEYLMNKGAEMLLNRGCAYINGQEDLGISGLRVAKNSYHPVKMLRKYTILKA